MKDNKDNLVDVTVTNAEKDIGATFNSDLKFGTHTQYQYSKSKYDGWLKWIQRSWMRTCLE